MKIGLKGTGINGSVKHIYFERVPGTHLPQVRITTNEGVIYVPENIFANMITELFKQDPDYGPKHMRGDR